MNVTEPALSVAITASPMLCSVVAQPAPGDHFSVAAHRAQQCLPTLLGEGFDEAPIRDREALFLVEAHAQQAHGTPLDHQRHRPERFRPPPAGRQASYLGKDRGIFLFSLGPDRDARGERLEHSRIALRLGNARDLLQHLGRYAALREKNQRFATVIQHIQRGDVRARLTHALFDHQIGDIALTHRAGKRERQLGQALQARQGHAQLLGVRRTFRACRVVHCQAGGITSHAAGSVTPLA